MQISRRSKRVLMAVLMIAGGLAVAYSPSSFGETAWPASPSAVYPGDGPVGKDAPWHVDALDFSSRAFRHPTIPASSR